AAQTGQGDVAGGLAGGRAAPADEVRGLGYAVAPGGDMWEVGLKGDETLDPVVDQLRSRGLGLRHLAEKRQTLEELFMATVEGAEPGVDTRAPVPPGPSPTGIQRPSGLTTGR